jgi:XRE family transcriptional regulator, regulator of sulfur utilization
MESTTFRQALGTLIARLRSEMGWSQERLALEADLDRTRVGEIERGLANPTIGTLDKIAAVLKQTLGSLILQAEDIQNGRIAPRVDSTNINQSIPLPMGLSHDQLEIALNRAMAILNQIGLDPNNGDIQANIFSGAVSNLVTKSIADESAFVQNKHTSHPDLFDPRLDPGHPDWGLEMKATNKPNKGAESHNPGHGWFMVVVYKVIDGQTHIIQVEVAQLHDEDWTVQERKAESRRTRTATTRDDATWRLRRNSVYLNPDHVPVLKRREQ